MAVTQLFRALGDPIRMEMVRNLSNGESYTITSVSSGLGITRQGTRKHLQVLADAGLITLKPKGRDTAVNLDRAGLELGKAFFAEIEFRWDNRLEALRHIVDD